MEITIGIEALQRLLPVGVAQHHLWTACADLALAIAGDRRAGLRVTQAHFVIHDVSVRIGAQVRLSGAADAERNRGRFGAAVDAK